MAPYQIRPDYTKAVETFVTAVDKSIEQKKSLHKIKPTKMICDKLF